MSLLVEEAPLAVPGVAQQLLKLHPVKVAVGLEHRVIGDAAHHVRIRQSEPHLSRLLIKAGFGDHVAQYLPIKAERIRLFRRQCAAELASDLLQPFVVQLAELLDLDFGTADLGERRTAKAAKDVVDAPDGKACGKQHHDRAHDGAAEPISGGVADSSKHFVQRVEVMPVGLPGKGARIIGIDACPRNRRDFLVKRPFSECKASANRSLSQVWRPTR